jgi:hypothetical protein
MPSEQPKLRLPVNHYLSLLEAASEARAEISDLLAETASLSDLVIDD